MKLIKQLLMVLALLWVTQAFAEPDIFNGCTECKILNPAQPTQSGNKIEVLEFFFYGCSHCYNLNPFISAWEKKMPKDVQFTYVPAVFNPTWEVGARTFYALEALGQQARVHDDLFNAWHDNIELVDEASTTDFLAKHGIDRKKFGDAYNSFSMQSQVVRAKQLGQIYNIRGTPTLIVNGQYLITGLYPAATIQVLNAVVDKVRKEHKH